MDTMTDLKAAAVSVTGLAESNIQSVAFELDYLKRNGLLIDITVGGIGMFSRSAQLAEFGIDKSDEKAKRYTPGSKYLIPKETVDRIRSVETRMRQTHVKFCMDVAGFRPYRWMPYTGYRAFKNRWQGLKQEFDTLKAEILENLDGYRDMLANEFALGAGHTWAAVQGQGYGAIIFNGRGYTDQVDFVDAVVSLALAQFPSKSKIETDLQADYKVGVLYTDFDFQVAQEEAQYAVATAKAEKQAAYLQASILQEQFDNELRMNRLAQQEKELQIEAMMAAEMEHAKSQLEEIRHPFEEVFIALRQEIAQACDEIAASIGKNGFVRGKIAERAAGLVEFYDLMAAHDDKDLRTKLVELKAKIGPVGEARAKDEEKRNVDSITETLTEITQMANLSAGELADLSRAAFVEI